MSAYLILTVALFAISGVASFLLSYLRGNPSYMVRAVGEFAIAAWGIWLLTV